MITRVMVIHGYARLMGWCPFEVVAYAPFREGGLWWREPLRCSIVEEPKGKEESSLQTKVV